MSPEDLQIDAFLQRVWSSRFLWKGELLDCAGKRDPLCWYVIVWFGLASHCHVSCPTDLIPSPLSTFHNVDTLHCLILTGIYYKFVGFQRLGRLHPNYQATFPPFVRARGSQQRHPIEPTHPLLPDGHEPRHGPMTFGAIAEWQNQSPISVVVENSSPHNS